MSSTSKKSSRTNLNGKERDKKTVLCHPDDKRTLGKCALLLTNEVDQCLEKQGLKDKKKMGKRRNVAMLDKQVVNSSLIRAIHEGNLERAKELINSFGLSYIQKWSDGYALLRQAMISKNTAITKLLLKHGCEVNTRDKDGSTILHYAVLDVGNEEFVATLLKYGADVNITNKSDRTAFDVALNHNNSSIALDLAHHVLKMIGENSYVNKRNKFLLKFFIPCSKWGQLETELEKMKRELVFCKISFYKIFIKGISLIQLCTMNENSLRSLLKSANWEAKFPVCNLIIARKFRKTIEKKVLLELANRSLHFLLNGLAELPNECGEKILSYLNNKELYNLIQLI